MKFKRIMAYVIDIFLVSLISSLIFSAITAKTKMEEYDKISQEYINIIYENGSGEINEDTLIDIAYQMQVKTKSLQIINLGLLFLYFGVLAYLLNGQTLGKKIFNIKVAPVKGKNLDSALFILRAVLVTNFIPKLIAIVVLLLGNKNTWFIVNNYVSYASTFLLFAMLGFMIFRDDERGLHDLICNTKVIDTKEKAPGKKSDTNEK